MSPNFPRPASVIGICWADRTFLADEDDFLGDIAWDVQSGLSAVLPADASRRCCRPPGVAHPPPSARTPARAGGAGLPPFPTVDQPPADPFWDWGGRVATRGGAARPVGTVDQPPSPRSVMSWALGFPTVAQPLPFAGVLDGAGDGAGRRGVWAAAGFEVFSPTANEAHDVGLVCCWV